MALLADYGILLSQIKTKPDSQQGRRLSRNAGTAETPTCFGFDGAAMVQWSIVMTTLLMW